jgi:hypothetical protein
MRRIRSFASPFVKRVFRRLCPDSDRYVIDRHHTLMAYWLVGVKRAPVSVEERLGSYRMSYARFWRVMSRRPACYGTGENAANVRDRAVL